MIELILKAAVVSNICIKHRELKNSSNPVQVFTAFISGFENIQLSPHVRYRVDGNDNLHVAQMELKNCANGNCTYSVPLGFDTPGKVSYSISSGDGFGHALWEPENGILGSFYILQRDSDWISVEKPEIVTKRRFPFNATFNGAVANPKFVFADTQESVAFDESLCVENECRRSAQVDVENRNTVAYYIKTEDEVHYWPDYQLFESFDVKSTEKHSEANTSHHAKLSDAAIAGIGVGSAIGAIGIVYIVVWAIRKRRGNGGSSEEKRGLISGFSI